MAIRVVLVGMADANRSWYTQDVVPLENAFRKTYGLCSNIATLQNPTKEEVLAEFAFDTAPETLIVYYSGHGTLDDDGAFSFCTKQQTGWLGPGSTSGSLSDTELTEAIRESGARKVFIVIDACHSGGFDVKADLESRLASLSAGHGTAVLAACVAEKTTPGSSPLTRALCNVLAANSQEGFTPALIRDHVKREMSDALLLTGATYQPFTLSPGMTVVASCRNHKCNLRLKKVQQKEGYGTFSITTLDLPTCSLCQCEMKAEYLHFDSCHWQVAHAYTEGCRVVTKSTGVMQSTMSNHWALDRQGFSGYRYLDVEVNP